jgi:hypothetical protein
MVGVPRVGAGAEDPAVALVVMGHQDREPLRLLQVGDGGLAAPQAGLRSASTIAVMVVNSGPGPRVDAQPLPELTVVAVGGDQVPGPHRLLPPDGAILQHRRDAGVVLLESG